MQRLLAPQATSDGGAHRQRLEHWGKKAKSGLEPVSRAQAVREVLTHVVAGASLAGSGSAQWARDLHVWPRPGVRQEG